jgi:hypothetical protein
MELEFFFVESNKRALCLICKSLINVFKICNLKRHYENHHKEHSTEYPLNTQSRRDQLILLKSMLFEQQSVMKNFLGQSDILAEASFIVSWNIARAKRPYVEGDFLKKNLCNVIKVLDPDNSTLIHRISNLPLSRHTVERRITSINECIETNLHNEINNSIAFSLALDESIDTVCSKSNATRIFKENSK